MKKIKCFFGFHKFKITEQGASHVALIRLHPFADTKHQCVYCGKIRNFLHTSPEVLLEAHGKGLLK